MDNNIKSDVAFNTILNANGFENKDKDKNSKSYYKTYKGEGGKTSILRLSNHLTYLWTWEKHGKYLSQSNNVCISLMDTNEEPTMENCKVDMNIYQKNDKGEKQAIGTISEFEVKQYAYNVSVLTADDIHIINASVKDFFRSGTFTDPLEEMLRNEQTDMC